MYVFKSTESSNYNFAKEEFVKEIRYLAICIAFFTSIY